MATVQEYLAKQKERRIKTAFAALIKNPKIGTFQMPSLGARMKVLKTDGAQDTPCLKVNDRTITFGMGTAQIIDFIPANVTVQVMPGFELYVDNGLNVFRMIARG